MKAVSCIGAISMWLRRCRPNRAAAGFGAIRRCGGGRRHRAPPAGRCRTPRTWRSPPRLRPSCAPNSPEHGGVDDACRRSRSRSLEASSPSSAKMRTGRGLALDPDQIELEAGEVGRARGGPLADQDRCRRRRSWTGPRAARRRSRRRRAPNSRSAARAEIADAALAGIDADADRDRRVAAGPPLRPRPPGLRSAAPSPPSWRAPTGRRGAAWSASSSGAFQNAMIASPMYLSMVPRSSRMMSVIGVRKRLMKRVSSCGIELAPRWW